MKKKKEKKDKENAKKKSELVDELLNISCFSNPQLINLLI